MTDALNEGGSPALSDVSGDASRGAVLVVDDIESNLRAMTALLSGLDCDVVQARSGNEALIQLLKRGFAVMLLDVQMPEMDGYEVAAFARQNPRTRDVPIVFVTANVSKAGGLDAGAPGRGARAVESVLRGYGSGAVDFLFKPVNAVILRSKVRVFLELDQGRRELRQAQRDLEARNRELEEAARGKAALAERFRQSNVELERACLELGSTQASLIQAAKMASLGELVAGIAHEINNPLAFCVSHVDTIRRSLLSVDERAASALQEADVSADWQRALSRLESMTLGLSRISDLVRKLRTFSRLDEGEIKSVNVKECIDSVLTILSHRLEPSIRVSVDCRVPECIDCNPALLNQVLMNLLANAVEAISGEGRISVSCGAAGDQYQIVVDDTGSGIDPKLRDRIFEPFFTTKAVGAGTGLGLSIAYAIVQKHRGTIVAQDAPGGGTRMLLTLPLVGLSAA